MSHRERGKEEGGKGERKGERGGRREGRERGRERDKGGGRREGREREEGGGRKGREGGREVGKGEMAGMMVSTHSEDISVSCLKVERVTDRDDSLAGKTVVGDGEREASRGIEEVLK